MALLTPTRKISANITVKMPFDFAMHISPSPFRQFITKTCCNRIRLSDFEQKARFKAKAGQFRVVILILFIVVDSVVILKKERPVK
jgi:hypothetical protein